MCGIAGILTGNPNRSALDIEKFATAMDSALAHRGPDGHGVWIDVDVSIALVHRRLAIIDLSPGGHQPMVSANGRFVLTYNGETYNHLEIRRQLEAKGVCLRGHSDSEVILESIAQTGVSATVARLIGMFAIAVWDRKMRTLTLVRDRVGIKPLYWAQFGSTFLFGSELKALREHPGWSPRLDVDAAAAFLRHNYVPTPSTIYEGVHKLQPGCILSLRLGHEPRIERYWDARDVAIQGLTNPIVEDDASLVLRLEDLLTDAVRKRMMSDVPLGAFLSGGVDSSLVVSLMKAANSGSVRTFSIGFENQEFNEAHHASAVAKHLGTEHTELMVTAREALEVVPQLAGMYDEPFADSSQIPTYLVSAMTRKHVTVALSGDGGDELFAGYNRYQVAARFSHALASVPQGLRNVLASGIRSVKTEYWDRLARAAPSNVLPPLFGDKLHKAALVLNASNGDTIYRRLISHWDPAEIIPKAHEPKGTVWDSSLGEQLPNLLDRMQYLDLVTYLPDDILTKLDRASMAVGLEARVPLLDHRVVELAWRLPHSVKIRNGVTKWLMRQVLYKHVPRQLIERPKMGFGIPLADWLRGPLRDWAENLVSEKRLSEGGVLNARLIRQHWHEHLSGRRNWQYLLWDVLMFEAWRERWSC